MMTSKKPTTLPRLLLERTQDSNAEIGFLDSTGRVIQTLSYQSLFQDAQQDARRLLASGLRGGGKDIVVTEFEDHQSHIRVFWACCLGECFRAECPLTSNQLTYFTSWHTVLPPPSSSSRPCRTPCSFHPHPIAPGWTHPHHRRQDHSVRESDSPGHENYRIVRP